MGDKFHLQGEIKRKELEKFPAPSTRRASFRVGLCPQINFVLEEITVPT